MFQAFRVFFVLRSFIHSPLWILQCRALDDLRCFGGKVWGRAGLGVVVPVPWIPPGWLGMLQSGFLQQGLAKSLTMRQLSGRLVYTGHLRETMIDKNKVLIPPKIQWCIDMLLPISPYDVQLFISSSLWGNVVLKNSHSLMWCVAMSMNFFIFCGVYILATDIFLTCPHIHNDHGEHQCRCKWSHSHLPISLQQNILLPCKRIYLFLRNKSKYNYQTG